jgi:CubicO group peptidase (beta-lactamase class C family)
VNLRPGCNEKAVDTGRGKWLHPIRAIILCLSLGSIVLMSCASLQKPEDLLTPRVAKWREGAGVQGVSLAVFNGTKIEATSDGVRSDGGQPIVTVDSFPAASVSKSFTAAAILRLVEQGVFRLDQSASELSGLNIPAEITITELLDHEAGLPEYMGGALSFETFLGEHANGREAWSTQEIRHYASSSAPRGETKFAYSNAHYVILGAIIEKQSGLPLAQALKALVFDPAGLASARLITSDADDAEVLGYSANMAGALGSAHLDRRLARELATAGDAAGGVVINSPDLARWAALYFSGEFVEGISFVAPKGGEAFGLNADTIGVGPGVYEVLYGDRCFRLHGGDGLGVTALAIYDPSSKRSVAILVNDDKVHSLGFGESGYLDTLALELLGD